MERYRAQLTEEKIMAQTDFSAWINELKDRSDIVSVVGSYVKLQRKGRHHWGLCPFHHEKTPSFSVNGDLQIFKCFGCGKAGDAIKFVQEVEHTDFNGAVEILAERAGMEIPKFGKEDNAAEQKRNKLISIMNAAQEFFVKQLSVPDAVKARKYIKERGLSEEIVKRFGLGYAPEGWENLKTYLLGKGFQESDIKETGLMSEKGTSWYDKFRNRIMYPIADERGNIISYGGRKINPEDEPKYLNCPQTFLYNKSMTLYGLDIAKNYGRGNSLIIVEGYMDVIAMHEFGFNTAIASCGTSLTQQQARKIKRFVDKVYIGYDGDAAGQHATIRGLDILKDTGLEVFVLSFPEGLDPDETLRQYGKEYFDDIIKNASRLEEFKIKNIFKTADLSTNEGKLKAAKAAIAVAASVELDIERERYVGMIVEKTGYSERAVVNDIAKASGKKTEAQPAAETIETGNTQKFQPRKTQAPAPPKNNDLAAEEKLICIMARDKQAALKAVSIAAPSCISDKTCRQLANNIVKLANERENYNVDDITAGLPEEETASAYNILMTEFDPSDILEQAVVFANRVRSQYCLRRADILQAQANEMINAGKLRDEECQRLIKETQRYRMLSKEIIK